MVSSRRQICVGVAAVLAFVSLFSTLSVAEEAMVMMEPSDGPLFSDFLTQSSEAICERAGKECRHLIQDDAAVAAFAIHNGNAQAAIVFDSEPPTTLDLIAIEILHSPGAILNLEGGPMTLDPSAYGTLGVVVLSDFWLEQARQLGFKRAEKVDGFDEIMGRGYKLFIGSADTLAIYKKSKNPSAAFVGRLIEGTGLSSNTYVLVSRDDKALIDAIETLVKEGHFQQIASHLWDWLDVNQIPRVSCNDCECSNDDDCKKECSKCTSTNGAN